MESVDFDCEEDEEEGLDNLTAASGSNDGTFVEMDFEVLGIDPSEPTTAKPGTEEKVLVLAARFAAGIPLWHDEDCKDHGPGASMARLTRKP